MKIKPEEISHPEPPEKFRAVPAAAIWQAGYETGFLGNPRMQNMPTPASQEANDDGFKAGAAARAEWNQTHSEAAD